jgi:lipopolysaccharide export system protein LptC
MSQENLSDLSNIDRDHDDVIKGTRSSVIRKLRIILPVIATCILFAVLVFSDRKDPIEARPIEEIVKQETGANELIDAQFSSKDEKDRPYTITSDRAYQEHSDSDEIQLENPKANLHVDNNTTISLEGQSGTYDQEKQLLHLKGNVKLLQNEGYEIVTDTVDININNQTANSNSPVSGQGPAGDIKASGLKASGDQSILIFKGPATLTLQPDEASNKEPKNKQEE